MFKKNKIIIAGIWALYMLHPIFSFAQREVLYAQYLVNPLGINPAATGIRQNLHLNAILRRQFIANMRSFPITQSIAIDGSISDGKIGLGLQALNDRVSLNKAIYGSFSYIHYISETQKLSIGVLGGINVLPNRTLYVGGNDQVLGSAGVGIYYEDETFFGGVSMPEILKHNGYNSNSALLNYQRPIFLQGGVKIQPNDYIIFKPSVLFTKPEGGKIRTDLNALANLYDKFMAGVSVRLGTTTYWQALLGYDINRNIRVGYNYSSRRVEDFLGSANSLPGSGKGIHEIVFTIQPNPSNQ